MRERVKRNFPMVLLTLLSIVQALALELLWSHVSTAQRLFDLSIMALQGWLQVSATLIGLVLIWVVYASTVMRFRWMPSTIDSVYPFAIGIIEFIMVETLGAEHVGRWLLLTALIFGFMHWVAHAAMYRARRDPDNDAFFDRVAPATLRDFYYPIAAVCLLIVGGLVLEFSDPPAAVVIASLLFANVVFILQFRSGARFWKLVADADLDD